jgi:hypothetical protein
MITNLINQIPGMKSYLELGIGNGRNFEAVECKAKTSVDVNGRATFAGTTDEFFSQLSLRKKFDVIFIDANHDFDFALRDFNHAVKHCRQWVLLHDLIPPSEKYTAPRFCSDSYKLLYLFSTQPDLHYYPMDGYYGLTFVRMPAAPIDKDERCQTLSFAAFQEMIKTVRLYHEEEIIRMLQRG